MPGSDEQGSRGGGKAPQAPAADHNGSESTAAVTDDREATPALLLVLARGGVTTFFAGLVSRACNLGLHVLLARSYSTAGYGAFVFGHSVVELSRAASGMGLPTAMERFGAIAIAERDRSRFKGLLQETTALSLTVSMSFGLLLFLAAGSIASLFDGGEQGALVVRALVVTIPLLVTLELAGAVLNAHRRVELQQVLQHVVRPLAVLAAVGVAVLFGVRLEATVWGIVGATALVVTVGIWVVFRVVGRSLGTDPPRRAPGRTIAFAAPVLLSSLLLLLMNHGDRLLVGYFVGAEGVALYTAAAQLSLLLTFFLVAFLPVSALSWHSCIPPAIPGNWP